MQAVVSTNNTGNFRNDVRQVGFDLGLSRSRTYVDIRINSGIDESRPQIALL